jgi:lsr operon transcriptional repressor
MASRRDVVHDGAEELALRAAWLYHVDELTQAEVAAQLHVSRPTVGRLLERAKAAGIVRVEIDARRLASFDLALRLQQRFALREAVVVPGGPPRLNTARRNERLATSAADYLRGHLHPGVVVGVAWGDTVQRTLAHFPAVALDGVTLATVTGGIEHITQRIMGHPAIAGHLLAVPAPLIVSSPSVARALREEPPVRDVLALARGAGLTLTGIGTVLPGSSAALSGLVSDDEVAQFAALGAVGDMLGEWLDARGHVVAGATSDRRIGIGLDELREMPNVVGIAGGKDKAAAIHAVLEGGYLNVLITDEDAAQELVGRTRSRGVKAGSATSRDRSVTAKEGAHVRR